MHLARLDASHGSRTTPRRPGLPASGPLLVAYAALHLVVFGYSGAMLDLAGFQVFWMGTTWLGLSLLDASVAVTALLALLIAAEEVQAWSRHERRVGPALVAYLVTLLLLHGLGEYLEAVARVAERMSW